MARISTCEYHEVSSAVCEIYDTYQRERGHVPNAFKTLAHRPEYLRTLIDHYRAVMFSGDVPFRLKELVLVRVSQLNACRY